MTGLFAPYLPSVFKFTKMLKTEDSRWKCEGGIVALVPVMKSTQWTNAKARGCNEEVSADWQCPSGFIPTLHQCYCGSFLTLVYDCKWDFDWYSFDSWYVNIYISLPVQVRPSPVYPGSQRQAKDPLVLLQYIWSASQLCSPVSHSFISAKINIDIYFSVIWRLAFVSSQFIINLEHTAIKIYVLKTSYLSGSVFL